MSAERVTCNVGDSNIFGSAEKSVLYIELGPPVHSLTYLPRTPSMMLMVERQKHDLLDIRGRPWAVAHISNILS